MPADDACADVREVQDTLGDLIDVGLRACLPHPSIGLIGRATVRGRFRFLALDGLPPMEDTAATEERTVFDLDVRDATDGELDRIVWSLDQVTLIAEPGTPDHTGLTRCKATVSWRYE